MITYKVLLLVVFLLLPHCPQAASTPAVWQGSNLYQTAIVTLVTSSATKTQSSTITFASPFGVTPNMITGITKMVSTPGDYIDFLFNLTSITSSSFLLKYIIGVNMSVSSMQVMYGAINPSEISRMGTYTWVQYSNVVNMNTINSGSGPRNATYLQNFTFWTGQVVNLSNTNKILVWLQSMQMRRNGGNFNMRMTWSFINVNNYTVTIYLNGTTTLHTLFYSRLIFDQTALQSTQQTFVDSGSASTTTNLADLAFTLIWKNNTNFFIGMTTFSFEAAASFDFTFSLGLTWTGAMALNWISFDYFNYRIRTCPAGYTYFDQNTNLCYDVCDPYSYPNNTINVCLACHYYCKTCSSNSSTACTSCDSGTDHRTLSGGACNCDAGYYDTGTSNHVCGTCLITCATCTTGTTCASCSGANFRTLTSGQCPCNTGYVHTGSATCAACNATITGCTSCTGTATCTACNTGNNFQLSGGSCICQTGFYLSGTSCLSCATPIPGCTACTTTPTCTACNGVGQFTLNGTICSCNSGYYLAGSTCTACTQVGCTNCTGVSTCTTCNATKFFQLSGTSCVCMSGYYLSGSTCISCTTLTGCLTCTGPSTCTGCNGTKFFQLSGSSCVCQSGYYISGGNCLTCSSAMVGCTACTTNAICTNCQSPLVVNGSSLCSCSLGYYQVGTNCIACSSAMTGCTSCTVNTACLTCDTSANFELNGTSLCSCKLGYFQSGTTCSACMSGCQNCTVLASCITCNATAHYVASGASCVCDTAGGYVLSGGVCVLCNTLLQGCTQCSSTSVCTICNASDTHLSLSGSTCVCDSTYVFNVGIQLCQFCSTCCSYGTYPDLVNGGCLPCSGAYGVDCLGCNENVCLNCVVDKYANGVTCTACNSSIPGCTSCTVSTTCNACDNAAHYLLSGVTCVCASGYAVDIMDACVPCSTTLTGCLVCSSLTACTSCDLTGHFISNSSNTSQCICATGYYPTGATCTQCSALGCLQCTSLTDCIACNPAAHFELIGLACSCVPGYYLDSGTTCLPCSVITGCERCDDVNTCTQCDTAAHFQLNTTASSTVNCDCVTGYYFDGTVCQVCSLGCISCNLAGCLLCNATENFESDGAGACRCVSGMYLETNDVCTACTAKFEACQVCTFTACTQCPGPVYTLISGACECGTNYFNNSASCQLCSTHIQGCIVCTAPACTQCNATLHFTLSGVSCACESGYTNTGTQCDLCSTLINGCEVCSSPTICTTCNATQHYIMGGGTCHCVSGYYMDVGLDCQTCSSAIPGCDTCTDMSTCTSCNATDHWQLSGTTCICAPSFVLTGTTCVTCMATCVCFGFAWDSNGVCNVLCGDGITLAPEECDDGNTDAGDGCSPTCRAEVNYTCQVISYTSMCSYNQPLNADMTQLNKDPVANKLTVVLHIPDNIRGLDTLDFSGLLSTDLPLSNPTFTFENGVLSVVYDYNQTVQGFRGSMTINPNWNSQFFAMPNTTINITIDPTNNLPAIYYNESTYEDVKNLDKTYQAAVYSSYGLLFLGMFCDKVIGIELFGVMQVAFLSLADLSRIHPMLSPLMNFSIVNGYNAKLIDSPDSALPNSVKAIGYSESFANNVNVMVLMILANILVAGGILIAGWRIPKFRELSMRISKRMLKEYLLMMVLFNCFNVAFSLGVQSGYSEPGGDYYAANLVTAGTSMLLAITVCVLIYATDKKQFAEFSSHLKPGFIPQSYFVGTIIYRILLGYSMGRLNEVQQSTITNVFYGIIFFVFIFANIPFIQVYHNYRALVIQAAELGILCIIMYYRSMKSTTPLEVTVRLNTPAIVQVFLMLASVGISAGCLFYELYLKYIKKEPEDGAKAAEGKSLFQVEGMDPDQINHTQADMVLDSSAT